MINKLIYLILLVMSLLHADKPITDNIIQGRFNIINGYSAECVMHQFYINSGWMKIEGEVGRNGIDGLYYKKKNGTIKEVLLAESKWNKSKLGKSGKNKLIKQMSQKWVLRTLNRLQKYKSLPEYSSINKFVQYNQYRARYENKGYKYVVGKFNGGQFPIEATNKYKDSTRSGTCYFN